MSDLLNQASLVMVPSGYKEDTVYSVVPSDGSGDLSFTRASNGTRINSAGLVEVCPWNLLQQSENYSVSPWNRSYITVTPNDIVAPNGTTTGNKIVLNNSGSQRYQLQQALTTNTSLPMTFTFYAKKNQIDVFVGVIGGASGMSYEVQFNLTNVTATEVYNSSGINTAKSIESVGNGWYKCTITAGSSVGLITSVLIFKDTTGNGTDSFYIWGAQLNIGSTAKPYFPTTDRLNVPRLTYQNGGGGCPSLLLEKQSTNLVSYSQDFTNAVYTKVQVTASTNATTSPDGTVNGNSIFETTVSSTHESWQRVSMTAGQLYTQSCFIKANGRNRVIMQIFDNSTQYASAIYDLSTGVVVASNGTATIQSMGNGWYRCTITGTSPATGSGYCVLGLCENTYTNSSVMPSYSGDTAKGVYWWGFQVENSSYPTSYIPTTSSSATRVADACFKTGISSLIGQTEGVVFCDFINVPNLSFSDVLSIGAVATGLVELQTSGGSTINAVYYNGGTLANIPALSTMTIGQRYKAAFAYKTNDFVFYLNGVQQGTDTSGTVTSGMAEISLNGYGSSTSNNENALINQAVIFPTRLTNAELASLTTI